MLPFGAVGQYTLGRWDPAAAAPVPTTSQNVTFSELRSTNYIDWGTDGYANYSSYLQTFYIIPEDAMTWMQSPYIYVFLENSAQEEVEAGADLVVDSNGTIVVTGPVSCLMNAIWDWSNTDEANIVVDSSQTAVIDSLGNIVIDDPASPKASRDIEVYRFRDGYLISVSKNKIRGRGKVLQLKFRSSEGKDFNLLGWGGVIYKNVKF